MSAHLVLVTLGPVQEFIAQARRTRDLWFGSQLLSELSRCAARTLAENGAILVFPALDSESPELEECLAPLRNNGVAPLSVANKILAEIPEGAEAEALARKVRSSVATFWTRIAADVRSKCNGLIADGTEEVWTEQIETFLEFAAAWSPIDDYASTRARVEKVIAGRKNLRDFAPWCYSRGGVQKSSLDGARESVLRHRDRRDKGLVRDYRIAEGEELDAVGLIKRTGGDPQQFVPIVNVAVASWMAEAERSAPQELALLTKACEETGVSRVRRPDLPCARRFTFDASVLFASRWKSVFEEQKLEADSVGWGTQYVEPIFKRICEPVPYVACLAADGDRMGRAIDRLATADAHRALSAALGEYAREARRIVEREHDGVLVYAGGDDVLAFLPLPTALQCAEELRRSFSAALAVACETIDPEDRPTLSVGIGVGHVLQSMGELLELGRTAERYAKRGQGDDTCRNAIAVVFEKRSGGRRRWRTRWDDWNGDPVGRLLADAAALEAQLSTGKVYEIGAILARLPRPVEGEDRALRGVLEFEVRRSLGRVGSGAGVDPATMGLLLDKQQDYRQLHGEVAAWVDRVLIARAFAAAKPRARRPAEVGVR